MKILQVHNTYQQRGGEDVVFNAEGRLLFQHGHIVKTLLFDNTEIKTAGDKLFTGIKSFFSLTSARQLKYYIEHFQPDIIHVHNFFPLASPSVFYTASKYDIPIVFTLHNYRLLCPSANLFHKDKIYENSLKKIFPFDAVYKGVYRDSRVQTFSLALMTALHNVIGTWKHKITKYIALTEFAKNLFVHSQLNIPEDQIIVKPNFVEDCGVGKKEEREDHFLFIGRLSSEKGIKTLLESASLYPYKLKIIGDGPLRLEVIQAISEHHNISYLGFKEKEEIIDELKKCKALIFPSLWYEGMPMTILEAFSTGTPVIASNLGGMAEMIEHDKNGLLFEAGNVYDLFDKILEIEKLPGLSDNYGLNARRAYEENYTPEANYQQLNDLYASLLKTEYVS